MQHHSPGQGAGAGDEQQGGGGALRLAGGGMWAGVVVGTRPEQHGSVVISLQRAAAHLLSSAARCHGLLW